MSPAFPNKMREQIYRLYYNIFVNVFCFKKRQKMPVIYLIANTCEKLSALYPAVRRNQMWPGN
jgi:hypothetical protein